jgi:hypothetical protein
MIWHSAKGEAPAWASPSLPEFGHDDWGDYFMRWNREVATITHEMVENIADPVHSLFIHGASVVPETTFSFEGPRMIAEFHNDLPSVGHKAINHVTAHGLGLVENRSEGMGEKAFFSAFTPIDKDRTDVWFSMLARKSSINDPTGEFARHSAQATVAEFAKDIPIWEAKLFKKHPLTIPDDGPLPRYRSWARQFF